MDTVRIWAEIVNPFLSVIAMVAIAIYSKREAARRESARQMAEDVATVRKRTHEIVNELQRLPSALKPHFVERGEWQQAERSADHIHETMNDRLAALEARR